MNKSHNQNIMVISSACVIADDGSHSVIHQVKFQFQLFCSCAHKHIHMMMSSTGTLRNKCVLRHSDDGDYDDNDDDDGGGDDDIN